MLSTRVSVCEDVIYQPLKDEVLLLNMQDQRYFGLDDVGSEMWKLLVDLGDMDAVVARICSEYNVDRATVEADIELLVQSLISAGLLKKISGPETVAV
jgi:predicted transcriptional regulator